MEAVLLKMETREASLRGETGMLNDRGESSNEDPKESILFRRSGVSSAGMGNERICCCSCVVVDEEDSLGRLALDEEEDEFNKCSPPLQVD